LLVAYSCVPLCEGGGEAGGLALSIPVIGLILLQAVGYWISVIGCHVPELNLVPLFDVPYSVFLIRCSLFGVPYSAQKSISSSGA